MTHDPASCVACSRDMPGNRCAHCGGRGRWVEAETEPRRRPVVVDRTLFPGPKKGRPSNAERARRAADDAALGAPMTQAQAAVLFERDFVERPEPKYEFDLPDDLR